MCFKSKIKTPKPQAPGAPQPVLAEDPKGVDFGGEDSGSESAVEGDTTGKITKIEREGESSDVPSALSTATKAVRKKAPTSSAAVRRAIAKSQ